MFHRPGRGVDLWDQTPSRRIQEISLKARRNVSSRGPQPPAAGKDIPIFEHLWSFWKYSRKIPVAASEAAPEAASSVAFGRRAPAPCFTVCSNWPWWRMFVFLLVLVNNLEKLHRKLIKEKFSKNIHIKVSKNYS